MSTVNAVAYRVGAYSVVHSAAGSLPAPSGDGGLDLAATFGPRRPEKLSVLVEASENLTLTNLIPWSRVGAVWATSIPPGGTTDVTHASVALTTAKSLIFVIDIPVHDRIAFQGTLSAGTVTISVAPIYEHRS